MRSVTLLFLMAISAAFWLERTLMDNAVYIVGQAEAAATDAEQEPPTQIEELTAEEIAEELKRAQEVLDDPDAPTEFVQSKPLPADIAIDLPSDI